MVVFVPLDEELIGLLRKRSGLDDDDLLVLSRDAGVIAGPSVGVRLPPLDYIPATVDFAGRKYRASGTEVDPALGMRLAVLVPS